MYWIYVKCATWLLNVRDFSFCITWRHVLESNVVCRGSSLAFLLSSESGIAANYYSTVSTSDKKHCESVTRSSKMYASWPAINRTIGCPPQGQSRCALGRLQVTFFFRKYLKFSACNSRRDCRQWCRTYLTYVKYPRWLLSVRDFSLRMTCCHVLASDIVHHGSGLTYPLSNGSEISANYCSTVSTSDMKHCESVRCSSKMYASWPAINVTIGCPPQGQSQCALERLQVTFFLQKYLKFSACNSRKKGLPSVV